MLVPHKRGGNKAQLRLDNWLKLDVIAAVLGTVDKRLAGSQIDWSFRVMCVMF